MGILEDNIAAFSSPKSVEAYSDDYLRFSEEFVINNYAGVGARVLDLGCGTGRTSVYLAARGAKVVAVDLAPGMIEQAKKLHSDIANLEFAVMDARKLVFPNESFDLVFFSFNGLDNMFPLSDREVAVKEIMRVLKPGGIFAYSSHNALGVPRTKAGILTLLRNLHKFSFFHPVWRTEKHDFGSLKQYYNTVWNEEKFIKKCKLKLVKRLGGIFERFPMYITQKQ